MMPAAPRTWIHPGKSEMADDKGDKAGRPLQRPKVPDHASPGGEDFAKDQQAHQDRGQSEAELEQERR